MTWESLIRLLKAKRLIDAHVEPMPPPPSIWTTQLLSVIGVWLAAVFLFGSLATALSDLLRSTWLCIGLGAAACAVVAAVNWRDALTRPAFVSQWLSAISFVGFALLVRGTSNAVNAAYDAAHDVSVISLAGMVWSLILWGVNRDALHRLCMAWVAVFCFTWQLASQNVSQAGVILLALGTTALWSLQRRWIVGRAQALLKPLAYATATAALVLALMSSPLTLADLTLFDDRAGPEGVVPLSWSPWVTIGVFCVQVGTVLLLSERWEARRQLLIGALAGLLIVALLTARMPGVLMCALIWTLGMDAGRRGLRGLALAGLPIGLLELYFNTQTTLLSKGMSLLGIGGVLVVASLLLRRGGQRGDHMASIAQLTLHSEVRRRNGSPQPGDNGQTARTRHGD